MKTIQLIFVSALALFLGLAGTSRAEDIDLYSNISATGNTPNLMFVVDSSANSSGNFAACTYYDGTSPSLGNTTLGNEQCALVNIMHSLPTNSVNGNALINLGIVTADGIFFPLTPIDDNAYTAPASPYTGTYTVAAGLTNRQAFIAAVKALTKHTGAVVQGPQMQETWAYYTGGNGSPTGTGLMSGNVFSGTSATTSCQKNYALFLGGVDTNAHADIGNSTPVANAPVYLNYAINNAVTAGQFSAAQQTLYKSTITTGATPDKYAGNGVAREWARFMLAFDANSNSNATGTQSIITYSLSIVGGANTDMTNFIADIGTFGGGKAFSAATYTDIYNDILKVLNEVQAVNSVFSSSTLPVSVNTQGTYLNQVFMGMFRPDANGFPRWVGNLKQYKFIYDSSTQTLSLGDSTGAAAISSAGTGFISPNAISFWTSKDTSSLPDSTGGFWINAPSSAGGGYDSPDGEVVEKGGVAQTIRSANLTDDYSTTTSTGSTVRNLYTYCPSGSSCNVALTDSSNKFYSGNSGISASSFGSSSTITISSITVSNSTTGTATVTTSGAHGFVAGSAVTIAGASPTDYNGTFTIATVPSTTTFTYCLEATCTGLTVTPTTPATGSYQVAAGSSSALTISNMTRTTNSSGSATETVTVTTSTNHNLALNDQVTISNVSGYSGNYTVTGFGNGASASTQFKFSINVSPKTPSTGTYTAALSTTPTSKANSSLTCTVSGSGGNKKATVSVSTSTAHGFVVNDYVTISGAVNAGFNGSFNLVSVGSTTTFSYVVSSGNSAACPANSATTAGSSIAAATSQSIAVGSLTRADATNTATATIPTANRFATGDIVKITQVTAGTDGSGYAVTSATITCATTACTSFTYPITITPSSTINFSSGTAQKTNVTQVNITSLTRSGSTATAVVGTAIAAGSITVSNQNGTAVPTNETSYIGSFTATCVGASPCLIFTYPVTVGPANSNSGSATSLVPPDKTTLVNWMRGQDNYGDEKGPGGTVTVRPSIHGDVLHSRPIVINYGGTNGIIAFYGSNDGVYHAVNGNQTSNPTGSSLPIPGSELWGFIPTEFYGLLNRLRTNSPQLNLPTTPSGITPTPQKKDYFVDGPTGVYQVINSSGVTTTAYIYLSMRRGGRLLYALDVTTPTSPRLLWKKSNASTDFAELGQTWSEPKVAFVKGYTDISAGTGTTGARQPVLIFGAGYDNNNEDNETLPATADSRGRGIFIVDATTGAMIWSARHDCTGVVSTCVAHVDSSGVQDMNYAIPADITLVDKNSDGVIDRLYATDLGGNVWRVDLEKSTTNYAPSDWQIEKLAALGCDSGVCSSSTTPRKFFYRADVIPTSGFDAVLVGSGDREHPLSNSAANSVTNRVYMLKDTVTGNDGSSITTPITQSATAPLGLVDETNATSTVNYGTLSTTDQRQGYFITLLSGEKVVNAPSTAAGSTFFGTNQPSSSTNACSANLGIARGYTLSPLTGTTSSVTFDGGGLPPTPVYGFVNITVTNADGSTGTKLVPFVIGAGNSSSTCTGADCKSSIGSIKPTINISTSRTRTHWYIERDQ